MLDGRADHGGDAHGNAQRFRDKMEGAFHAIERDFQHFDQSGDGPPPTLSIQNAS